MRVSAGTRVRQWLLLCALVLALVGMHHLAFASHGAPAGDTHMTAPAGPSPPDGPADDHDLMHDCPAVLHATGDFPPLTWLWPAVDGPGPVATTLLDTRLFPPPRPAGRSLLTSVCVLRT